MRAILVDDEQPARLGLRTLLGRHHPDVEIVAEAGNGVDALEAVELHTPDALFLDIEMPGLSGLDVALALDRPPAIVFVTAYDQYAVKAFETSAIDYLLKPVHQDALGRAVQRIRDHRSPIHPGVLRELRQAIHPEGPAKLAARSGRKIVLISRRDLLYAEAEDRLVFFHTAQGGKFLTNRTIAELEQILPEQEFFRVHRGALVALDGITEMYPWMSSGAWRVKLRTGVELDVSRDRVRALREKIGL